MIMITITIMTMGTAIRAARADRTALNGSALFS